MSDLTVGTGIPDVELQQRLLRQLSPGERILWSGRPRGGLRLQASDALLIPFSLIWGGFAFFWEYTAISTGGPLFMRLWGVPFVCIGIYMVVGRFFVDALQRSVTAYAVTNQRAIICSGLVSPRTDSFELRTLTDVQLSERQDGSGNITFGRPLYGYSLFANSGWFGASRYQAPGFRLVENAKTVLQTLRSAQESA